MTFTRRRPIRIVTAVLAAAIGIGVTVTPASAATNSPATTAPVIASASGGGGSGTGGGGGGSGSTPAPAMPVDWPAAVPVPAGTLLGSTGKSPQWSLLLDVRVGATQLQRSTVAFYVARGFTTDTASIVHNAKYRVVILAVNRDHSASRSHLAIGLIKL